MVLTQDPSTDRTAPRPKDVPSAVGRTSQWDARARILRGKLCVRLRDLSRSRVKRLQWARGTEDLLPSASHLLVDVDVGVDLL